MSIFFSSNFSGSVFRFSVEGEARGVF
jgi:hypothetical protein